MKKVLSVILILTLLLTAASVSAFSAPNDTATVTVIGKDSGYYETLDGTKTGLLRFLAKIDFQNSYDLSSYGMKFIPLSIFDNESVTSKTWASVTNNNSSNFNSGNTFTADLENISETFFGEDFLGVAFASFQGCDDVVFSEPSSMSVNKVDQSKKLGIKQNLQCDANGDFRILIVADPHGSWEASAANLETLLTKTNPDFVIIHGDIYMSAYGAMDTDGFNTLVTPLTERGIPWTITNGNHDPYTDSDWATFTSYNGFLGEKVSSSDPNYVAERPVNYVLPIYANDGKTPVFNIWAMDTGKNTSSGKYDGVTAAQIDWYKAKSAELKALYGKDLAGLMCIHIPPTEMIDLYYSKIGGGTSTVGTAGNANLPIYGQVYGNFAGVTDYTTSTGTFISSTAMNATHPSNNRGLFTAIKETGNINVLISGHDHLNNFIGNYQGILMGFTGRIVDETYSRGARIIDFNQESPNAFTASWISLYDGGEDQPPIYQDGSIAYR